MSFESLIEKVHEAEHALEARERQTAADWRQCKASWTSLWTPGRLLSVGLVSGFLVGAAEPAKRVVRGSGTLQLLSAVAGLFAGGSAQAAAGHAQSAADSAQTAAVGATNAEGFAPTEAAIAAPAARGPTTPEALRAAGLL
jgi:hypothetical protein